MGKDVTDKSDGTAKSDGNPEVQSVREENRRLFELVERLIATQESEQQHRKVIETELQQMKLALVEPPSSGGADAVAEKEAADLSKSFEKHIEKLGAGLESKLLSRMEDVEKRITALAVERADVSPEESKSSEELVNATWKMIAPLGGELERLSAMMQDLMQRVDQVAAESRGTAPQLSQELKGLVEEIRQVRSEVAGGTQHADENSPTEALAGLDTHLQVVSKSLEDLLVRQDDAQAQTSALLRGLFESHMERLSHEWAEQIAGVQRSLDELRLDQTAPVDVSAADRLTARKARPRLEDQVAEVQETTPNVVAGDFPAFQRTDAKSADEKTSPEPALKEAVDNEASASKRLEAELPDIVIEDSDADDALLTEPADWHSESETEEKTILLTHPILPDAAEKAVTCKPEPESVKQVEFVNETATATSGRREIDLRAFKDLRLSSEPGDAKDPAVTLPTGARGPSYENAPAEASLTRFVRLIRARKRSSPS